MTIDGNEIPSSANLVERIVLTEGNGALSPAFEIVFNDTSGHLGRDLALTDGNPFVITIGKSPGALETVPRKYRLFGHRQAVTAFGPQITAVGVLDAPNYLAASAVEATKGNSGQALKALAGRSSMEYSGPEDFNGRQTDDTQLWRAVCSSRAMHAQEICRKGYIDPHSAMVLMATSAGILKYRNIIDVINSPLDKVKRVFIHSTPSASADGSKITYQVRQAKDRSVSGLMNSWQNYGSTRFAHSLVGEQDEHKEIDVKTKGGYLSINADVSASVVRARKEYGPLECGNTHKNYQRAVYQNIKQLGLFSERISILTIDVTDVQILDPVIYRQSNADLTEPIKNTDIYVVVGKTVYVRGGMSYAERLELARMSLTTKGESNLKNASPSEDRDNVIPSVNINPTVPAASASLPGVREAANIAAPCSSVMGGLRSVSNDFNSAVQPALTTLNFIMSQIRNYTNPQYLLNALQASIPVLQQVGSALDAVYSVAAQAHQSASSMLGMLNAVPTLSRNLRTSVLNTPRGVVSSFAYGLGATKQLNDMSRVLGSINFAMSSMQHGVSLLPGGASVFNQFSNSASTLRSTADRTASEMAGIWNLCVAAANKLPMPSDLDDGASYPGGYFDRVVEGAFVVPNSSLTDRSGSQDIEEATQRGIVRRIGLETYCWQPVTPYGFLYRPDLSTTDIESKLLEMESDAAAAAYKARDLGRTWN